MQLPSPQTIHAALTMGELLERFPGARRALFRKYHIGGCSSCGFRLDETLAEVCARNDELPVADVEDYLRRSAEEDEQFLLNPQELDAFLQQTGAVLLDIRTAEEFDAVHIDGSRRFTQELMQESLANWPRTVPIAVIDHTGTRSLDAAAYFTGHGFTNIRAVRGGLDAYSEQVDPQLPRYSVEWETP